MRTVKIVKQTKSSQEREKERKRERKREKESKEVIVTFVSKRTGTYICIKLLTSSRIWSKIWLRIRIFKSNTWKALFMFVHVCSCFLLAMRRDIQRAKKIIICIKKQTKNWKTQKKNEK